MDWKTIADSVLGNIGHDMLSSRIEFLYVYALAGMAKKNREFRDWALQFVLVTEEMVDSFCTDSMSLDEAKMRFSHIHQQAFTDSWEIRRVKDFWIHSIHYIEKEYYADSDYWRVKTAKWIVNNSCTFPARIDGSHENSKPFCRGIGHESGSGYGGQEYVLAFWDESCSGCPLNSSMSGRGFGKMIFLECPSGSGFGWGTYAKVYPSGGGRGSPSPLHIFPWAMQ